jgi:hypothetical protein
MYRVEMSTLQVTAPKLRPDGKVESDPANPGQPLLETNNMTWEKFKTQFNYFLSQTAALPPNVRGLLAPSFIYYEKQLNELTTYVLKVFKMPGNTRYGMDSIRQSTKETGPADMLQRTYSDGIEDLIEAIENKMANSGLTIGGRRRRKSRRRRSKSRRRN